MNSALIGTKEIAELLGVSRQRVSIIAKTHQGFPKPISRLAAGRIWRRAEVVAWVRKSGRRLAPGRSARD
jgi:prophage regulatory protein